MSTLICKSKVYIFHCKPWGEETFAFASMLFDSEEFDLKFVPNKGKFDLLPEFLSSDTLVFIHWNWIVPTAITDEFNCICFHMTDLPYGRGGSPLQNLIMRGALSTKISAIKMTEKLDAGPIFLKRDLQLSGSAQEIYKKAGLLSLIMAKEIFQKKLVPLPQQGAVVDFKRLKESNNQIDLTKVKLGTFYDMVRMLDAPSYPSAYIRYGNLKIKFKSIIKTGKEYSGEYTVEENDYEH